MIRPADVGQHVAFHPLGIHQPATGADRLCLAGAAKRYDIRRAYPEPYDMVRVVDRDDILFVEVSRVVVRDVDPVMDRQKRRALIVELTVNRVSPGYGQRGGFRRVLREHDKPEGPVDHAPEHGGNRVNQVIRLLTRPDICVKREAGFCAPGPVVDMLRAILADLVQRRVV